MANFSPNIFILSKYNYDLYFRGKMKKNIRKINYLFFLFFNFYKHLLYLSIISII